MSTFDELTAPYLRELHVHCYRMLGSLDDADDLVQETLLAAWRGFDTFEGRASLRAWLYRIATNRCLNAIRDGKRRPPLAPAPPFEPPPPNRTFEVPWLQPYPDDPAAAHESRESIELAFVTALQLMPPRQTAALLLCDVLGFGTAEVADMLDVSPTALKGVLQRARAAVRASPERSRDHDAELAERFAKAFAADDVQGVVDLLTDDAWLAMPPATHEYHGLTAVAAFLQASADARDERFGLVPVGANAQPAFACFYKNQPAGVLVLTTADDRVAGITRFLDPGLHRHFGLRDRSD